MTRDQARLVLQTKVQAATQLLADIRNLALEHSLTVYIPTVDVDGGTNYGSVRNTENWDSSSESWDSSSYSC